MLRKYWLIFLLLFAEGTAVMAVELIGAKLMAPFYGSSLYVWTAVLICTISGLGAGYYYGGVISRRSTSERWVTGIAGIGALLVALLPSTSLFAAGSLANVPLIPAICMMCALLLVPPMFCFGLIGPMSVELINRSTSAAGTSAGLVFFISTLSGGVATFLWGYYLIPVAGLRYSINVIAVLLALLPIIHILRTLFLADGAAKVHSQQNSKEIGSVSGTLKTHTSSTIKVPLSLYWYAAAEGAAVMAIELIGARMLAPYFGSSLYVWATIIGVTFLSLAAGYFLGGLYGDKLPGNNLLYWALLGAGTFIGLMHYYVQAVTMAMAATDSHVAIIIVSTILIWPPLFLLGMVPPVLVRSLAGANNAGWTVSKVYSISSIASIISLCLLGFIIIPNNGLTGPSIVIGCLLGIFPFIKLVSQKKYAAYSFIALILLSISLKTEPVSSEHINVLQYSEGIMGQILVADITQFPNGKPITERALFVNRIGETFMDPTNGNAQSDYIGYCACVASGYTAHSKALVVGLGGGLIANIFYNRLKFDVDAVEIDERIEDAARAHFGLNPNINVVIDDARHYLRKNTKKYDVISIDVFHGDTPPAHMLTAESFKNIRQHLNDSGIIMLNFFGFLTGNTGRPARSVYTTLVAAGFKVDILPTTGKENERNILFVASKVKHKYGGLKIPLELWGKQVAIDTLLIDVKQLNLGDAYILTDNKPIFDKMILDVSNNARMAYDTSYTKLLWKNNVPLFR